MATFPSPVHGLLAAFAFAVPVLCSGPVLAQNLIVLGKALVDVKRDRQVIDLRASRGSVVGLRLRAADGKIVLTNVRVTFSDGTVHNERRRINLLDGERTRPFDLADKSERFVDEIELAIESQASAREPTEIEVLAEQTSAGRSAQRPSGTRTAEAKPVEPTKAEAKPADAKPAESKAAEVATPAPKQADTTTALRAPAAKATAADVPARSTTVRPATAQTGERVSAGDVLFGAARVGFGVDRDVIRVGSEVGKFQRMRLRVLENDIFINEMKLVYADGTSEAVTVDAQVDANTVTQWFKLAGDRFIQEIHLTYRSKPNFNGRARVEVFGDYAENWLGPDGEGRRYNAGWSMLGAETAGFAGFDRGVIPVARNGGGFKKLRVTVRDRAVTLDELRIVYEGGKEDIVPVKTRVDAGSTWGPVDLRGNTRITEIRARYRSVYIDPMAAGKGSAIVEIWATH